MNFVKRSEETGTGHYVVEFLLKKSTEFGTTYRFLPISKR